MIEEHHRDDGFEVTFVVTSPRDAAWKLLTEAAPGAGAPAEPRAGQWWIPGVEAPADELEVDPGHRLRARKATMPCKDTEIVVTMEDADTGTRITFVQTGFGPGFGSMRPWLEAGWWSIRADLVLYFERGVAGRRHLAPWSSIGCGVVESGSGLVLSDVQPGGFADQAGAQEGDLVLALSGSPVVTVRELSVLLRAIPGGTRTTLTALRGVELVTGVGVL